MKVNVEAAFRALETAEVAIDEARHQLQPHDGKSYECDYCEVYRRLQKVSIQLDDVFTELNYAHRNCFKTEEEFLRVVQAL